MSDVVVERTFPGGRLLQLRHGDLTEEQVDAIVNAANEHLAHGGGVAGAIVRRGGPEIQRESGAWVRANGPASHARPGLTGAGRLPCRAVIHAVGPIWRGGLEVEADLLASAYSSSLAVAEQRGLASIAFPSISTGIYGYPIEWAAGIAIRTVAERLAGGSTVQEAIFVLFSDADLAVYEAAAERWSSSR